MTDAGVGRLLVASLHQGIADVLPARLDFYEEWLNPAGLRDGKIGLAPMAAVLSFLRKEGDDYHVAVARAGEYTAQWTLDEVPSWRRRVIGAAPRWLRLRLIAGLAKQMVRRSYGGSRIIVKWRQGRAAVDIRGSLFCEVREPVPAPLCGYYAAALGRLFREFDTELHVASESCRAVGAGGCLVAVSSDSQGPTP
jgi:predicted hydrocarbon binding protein